MNFPTNLYLQKKSSRNSISLKVHGKEFAREYENNQKILSLPLVNEISKNKSTYY